MDVLNPPGRGDPRRLGVALNSITFHGEEALPLFDGRGDAITFSPSDETIPLLALIGGGVLMLMSDELIWGGGGRFVFGCYLGLVMSHFVVDTGVWRLSGSFQRQYLSEPFDFILARPR